jgi:hypothetical protein
MTFETIKFEITCVSFWNYMSIAVKVYQVLKSLSAEAVRSSACSGAGTSALTENNEGKAEDVRSSTCSSVGTSALTKKNEGKAEDVRSNACSSAGTSDLTEKIGKQRVHLQSSANLSRSSAN